MTPAPWPKPSLRARLVKHVLIPLAATWALGTAVSIVTAHHFAEQAFDRSLLDDAYLLASHVASGSGSPNLSLSAGELNAALFDQSETKYFSVQRADGTLIAGAADLHPTPLPEERAYSFQDVSHRGRMLRTITLRRSAPIDLRVVVAQTTHSRTDLLQRQVILSTMPQIVLLLLLMSWLHLVIRSDLAPLRALQQTLDRRDASDLTPVPAQLAGEARSLDIERLGNAANALLARLAESMRAQREFSGNVAHGLRTPLAGVRALAAYGLSHSEPAVWRAQLKAIAESEARASHLVDQLLALALADESKSDLRLAPLALHAMVRDAVLRFMPQADQLQADLGASGLEDPVHVLGNAGLVEGLLDNLIDNALRYGHAPGRDFTVTVGLTRVGDTVELAVSDAGPGLDDIARTRLMQRWSQGEAGLQLARGSGLGLAIVKRYAELLNAPLRLETPPQGLRAVLVFKLVG